MRLLTSLTLAAAAVALYPAALSILATPAQASSNLVVNGDFELGNTGFTSDYNYYTGGDPGPSWETVGTNGQVNNGAWNSGGDHTTGTGNFLIVDGNGDSTKSMWNESIGVQTGHTYEVSGWFRSLYPASPATTQFTIDGSAAGSSILVNDEATWHQNSFLWTATSNTLNLGLVDLNTQGFGNDFGVDDLSVKAVPESSTVVLFGLLALGGIVMLRKRSATPKAAA